MGLLTLFLFTLFALSSILPGGLARPRRCPTNNTANGDPPSFPYSLPPTRTNVASGSASLSPSPIIPESTSSPLPSSSSPPAGESIPSSDIQAFLDTHNTFRAQHGASPLTWSDNLSLKAKEWAERCQFEHSASGFGENLAAGTGSYDIAAAVKAWTDEVSDYDPQNPTYSHFTQVVWKSTKELGCFLQLCNNDNIFQLSKYGPTKFVVCEYFPAGNVIGQFSENVQK